MIYFKLTLMSFLWGGTFIAGKLIATDIGPYSAAFLRFVIASSFLLILVYQQHGRWPTIDRSQWLPLLVLGLSGIFCYNLFFFKGLELIEASRAAIIIASNPVVIAVIAALLFAERLGIQKALGVLISLAGTLVTITRGELSNLQGTLGWGELFIGISVLSWVTYSLVGKRVLGGLSPLVSVCYSTLIGTLLLAPPALHEGVINQLAQFSVLQWGCLFYLGFFGTVLGFIWYYQGIQQVGALRAGLFINLVPIAATLLSVLILKEQPGWSLLLGLLMVSGGVLLVNTDAALLLRRPHVRTRSKTQ
ncbi:EamA family transporter [Aestuariirhabdus sp. Z084]|uniref:DMT family transporter n=1 Tax=Aestuariirhabdus haliotis TaxID=2918751 RepID=UPI00201B3AAB|nr:EamA family transporter [Aestuariirhabdus haliotis]MCL6415963.1 EamA family transporter [Aestuariirhabdus haliotis]MCL6420004.1 EamA family transporter [Aestuariirhabdus haliotis]